jgi:hypothetical protein
VRKLRGGLAPGGRPGSGEVWRGSEGDLKRVWRGSGDGVWETAVGDDWPRCHGMLFCRNSSRRGGISADFMVHGSWLHRDAAGAFQCRAPAGTAAEAPMAGMLHRRSSAVEVCGRRAILAFGIRQVTHRTKSAESDMPRIGAAKRTRATSGAQRKGYPRGHGSAKLQSRSASSTRAFSSPPKPDSRMSRGPERAHTVALPGPKLRAIRCKCTHMRPQEKQAGPSQGQAQGSRMLPSDNNLEDEFKKRSRESRSALGRIAAYRPALPWLCEAKFVSKPVSNLVRNHATGQSCKRRRSLFVASFPSVGLELIQGMRSFHSGSIVK